MRGKKGAPEFECLWYDQLIKSHRYQLPVWEFPCAKNGGKIYPSRGDNKHFPAANGKVYNVRLILNLIFDWRTHLFITLCLKGKTTRPNVLILCQVNMNVSHDNDCDMPHSMGKYYLSHGHVGSSTLYWNNKILCPIHMIFTLPFYWSRELYFVLFMVDLSPKVWSHDQLQTNWIKLAK